MTPLRAQLKDSACPHCGTPVEGEDDRFCCRGCEMAAEIIHGAGLERYYTERTAFPPRPEPADGDWTRVTIEQLGPEECEARLVVDGLRCASCVWITEKVLGGVPGVTRATVSYATGRATLRWNPRLVGLSALTRLISTLGYRPRPLGMETAPDRDLMLRFGVAAFAAMNIMLLTASLYAGWWGGMEARYAALLHWTALVLATPVALWSAAPFFQGAIAGLRSRVLHMDLPIALGIAVLYLHGTLSTLIGRDGYLDSLAMLVTLLLGGRMLESRGRRRAVEAATALAGSLPRTARRMLEDRVETVPVGTLRAGDLLDVGAGDEIPADGAVVEGTGQVRMGIVTGEAEPVLVTAGDRVVAGSILAHGALTVRAELVGEDTIVGRMAAGLQTAADRGMAPTSADRIAPWFTVVTLAVASLTFAGWWWAAGVDRAIACTVAVLVVACPCALALSQPLAAAAGLGAAARRGLLLRSSDALVSLAQIDIVALDKTGTVTGGVLAVTQADNATLRIAAGLERFSSHPVGRAIVAETIQRGIPLPRAQDVEEQPGFGITGTLDGVSWQLRGGGPGEVVLTGAGHPARAIHLGDTVRSDSADAIERLSTAGLHVALLSGDHPAVAQRIARQTGIREVVARADPANKVAWITRQQEQGHRVLFAGDGLNDGPALGAADVGIAMGTGAASTVLVADGLISSCSVAPIMAGIRASRQALRAIRTSQRWSIAYNVAAVSLAAAGLVNPLVAAVLMPISSGTVIWRTSRVESALRREESWTR